MTDEEHSDSRTDSLTEEDDYGEAEEAYDDEGTLDEEEMLNPSEDYNEELKLLADDANLTVEQLRARYYGNGVLYEEEEEEDEEEPLTDECQSSSTHDDRQSPSVKPNPQSPINAPNFEESAGSSVPGIAAKKPGSRGYFSEEEENEEDDEYVPPDPWRKSVRQGPYYQASIPPFVPPASDCSSGERGELLWMPPSPSSFAKVESFLRGFYEVALRTSTAVSVEDMSRISSASMQQPLRDDESALKGFMDAGYDVDAALQLFPFPQVLTPRITIGPNPQKWDETDCHLFEEGIRFHGKNFSAIRNSQLPHRTVGELVQFYYIWKKTERHDVFEQRLRAAKRQEHAHCTDYMGRLIEHMDATSGDSSMHLPAPLELSAPSIPANLELIAAKEWSACWQSDSDAASALPHLDNETIANVLQ